MAPSNRLLRLSQAAVPHVIVPVLAHASPSPERARQYNRQKRRATLLALGIGWLASTLAVLTGVAGRIHQRVRRRDALSATAAESTTIAILSLLGSLASLPFGYYSGYVLEHRFNLSNQTRRAWAWEEAKALALGLAFEVPGAQLVLVVASLDTVGRVVEIEEGMGWYGNRVDGRGPHCVCSPSSCALNQSPLARTQ